MKRLLSCCLVPLAVTTVFPLVCAHAQDAAAPAADATAAQASFADPKAAYRTYIEAVRAMDAAAALKCWVYEPEQEEAMRVVSGVWISHRRFEKAVDSVPAVAAEKKSLEGYVRPDVTDQALDAVAAMLATAEVKENGGTTELVFKWDELKGDAEDCFLSGNQPAFRKVDGLWKLTPVSDQGSLLGDGDFFAEGGWGRMFRDGVVMLDEAAEKLRKGEIKTPEELRKLLGQMEKEMMERNERESREKAEKDKATPRPQ